MEANLHPAKTANGDSKDGATLPAPLALAHQLRADALPGMRIAFAWFYLRESGTYWQDGGTGGCSAYAFFNPAAVAPRSSPREHVRAPGNHTDFTRG